MIDAPTVRDVSLDGTATRRFLCGHFPAHSAVLLGCLGRGLPDAEAGRPCSVLQRCEIERELAKRPRVALNDHLGVDVDPVRFAHGYCAVIIILAPVITLDGPTLNQALQRVGCDTATSPISPSSPTTALTRFWTVYSVKAKDPLTNRKGITVNHMNSLSRRGGSSCSCG